MKKIAFDCLSTWGMIQHRSKIKKFPPLVFALLFIGCSARNSVREIETEKISRITLTDNTIREAAKILQKCIDESNGSVDVVVERQKDSDSTPVGKRVIPSRINLDETNIDLEAICELISFQSHTFYRISPRKVTFYEPKIPAVFGTYPRILFSVKEEETSYFSVSLQEGTPYNPSQLYANRKKWNFSAEFRHTSKGPFVVFTNRSHVDIPIGLKEWLDPNKSDERETNVKGLGSVAVPWRDDDRDDKTDRSASFTFLMYDEGAFKWPLQEERAGRRLR